MFCSIEPEDWRRYILDFVREVRCALFVVGQLPWNFDHPNSTRLFAKIDSNDQTYPEYIEFLYFFFNHSFPINITCIKSTFQIRGLIRQILSWNNQTLSQRVINLRSSIRRIKRASQKLTGPIKHRGKEKNGPPLILRNLGVDRMKNSERQKNNRPMAGTGRWTRSKLG